MHLSKAERETIIIFNEENDTATVYTCNKPLMKKLDSYCEKNTRYIVKKQDEYSKEYEVPKRSVNIRFLAIISDETRAKMAARAKRLSNFKKDHI